MIETTERFLKEIADKVGVTNVEMIHLFPPIRQGGLETGAAVVAASAPGQEKHTVYSASYRNTLKGPDRGKWEVDVTAEADAPLLTVDAVVQGVMKRAGEQFEPERLSSHEFKTIIGWVDQPQTLAANHPEEPDSVENGARETEPEPNTA